MLENYRASAAKEKKNFKIAYSIIPFQDPPTAFIVVRVEVYLNFNQ